MKFGPQIFQLKYHSGQSVQPLQLMHMESIDTWCDIPEQRQVFVYHENLTLLLKYTVDFYDNLTFSEKFEIEQPNFCYRGAST